MESDLVITKKSIKVIEGIEFACYLLLDKETNNKYSYVCLPNKPLQEVIEDTNKMSKITYKLKK